MAVGRQGYKKARNTAPGLSFGRHVAETATPSPTGTTAVLRTPKLLANASLALALTISPCFAAQSPQAAAGADSTALHRLFEDYFERSLQLNPLGATFIGDHRYD